MSTMRRKWIKMRRRKTRRWKRRREERKTVVGVAIDESLIS